uniref:Uncharacterized protein n=1 Tax=Aureoumbra lagunensis TaxID=44058 RepID=A0A7S3NHV6_9STRA
MRRPRGVDELRLFDWNDTPWLSFVGPARCPFIKNKSFKQRDECSKLCALDAVTYLVPLHSESGEPMNRPRPILVHGAPLGPNQRGLSPFIHENELFLSFSVEPHAILSVKIAVNDTLAHAKLASVATNDELWRDIRALDGGCLTRIPILASTPAIRISDSEFLTLVRTQLELGCLRFYEHYAVTFEARPPFRLIRRSTRPLPLAARSFAPARTNECRPNDAYRVRSGRAKSAAGLSILHDVNSSGNISILISYSAGSDWRYRSLVFSWNDFDTHLQPLPPNDSVLQPCTNMSLRQPAPECLVQAKFASECAASRNQQRRYEFLGLGIDNINNELSPPADLYRPFFSSSKIIQQQQKKQEALEEE